MGLSSISKILGFMTGVFDPKTEKIGDALGQSKPKSSEKAVEQPFERVTPKSQNIPSATILDFLQKIENDKTVNLHNLMIIKNGKVVFEIDYGQHEQNVMKYVFSASKSVTSLAVGMLIDEGKLNLDDRAVDFFENVSPLIKIKLMDLTVENLLTMQSGATFNEVESRSSKEWTKDFFNSIAHKSIGKVFNYNSLNTYILSAIVCKVANKSLTDYLTEKLFNPLSIQNIFWEKSPENFEIGGWGLFIKPEDLAKIGQLLLNGGAWNGKQIISESFIKAATTAHAKAPDSFGDFDYGYQIWCGRRQNMFLFNGMFGQNMLCFPENNIILLSFAGNNETFQQNNYFKYAIETFSKPFNQDVSESKAAINTLYKYKQEISQVTKKRKNVLLRIFGKDDALPKECKKIAGLKYNIMPDQPIISLMPSFFQIVQNCYGSGINKLQFEVENNKLYLHLKSQNESFKLPIGMGKSENIDLKLCGGNYKVALMGSFATDEDQNLVLKLTIDYLELPFSISAKLFFAEDELVVKIIEIPSSEFILSALVEIKNTLQNRPIIGAALKKVDSDYLRYLSDRAFSPTAHFIKDK